jgi:protein adenylyltransferase SelO-like protein
MEDSDENWSSQAQSQKEYCSTYIMEARSASLAWDKDIARLWLDHRSYGPCAFMDSYDPATVFSSIDSVGRYAYGNQPRIARWNLARFAEAILPLSTKTRIPPSKCA